MGNIDRSKGKVNKKKEGVKMIEKVNPKHPDKVADRIAGAIVDLAYTKSESPKVAVEVLIGHGVCHVIVETSEQLTEDEIATIVKRIAGNLRVDAQVVKQDKNLAQNQSNGVRCGDNGIFKGVPVTEEQKELSRLAREIYKTYSFDGKYILDGEKLIICQSNAKTEELRKNTQQQLLIRSASGQAVQMLTQEQLIES